VRCLFHGGPERQGHRFVLRGEHGAVDIGMFQAITASSVVYI
jgi:hypothetical protein